MAPTLAQLARAPVAAIEMANILLTTQDATIGASPKDVVWTHRTTTLYRYRSNLRTKPVPVLLVFALINRPDIFDLRPGNSFVEYLLDEGYDVFLVDWGVPGEEDRDIGLDTYVCDELPVGDARGPARERPGGAEPRRLVHRRRARGDARRDRARRARRATSSCSRRRSTRAGRCTRSGSGDRTSTPTTSPTRCAVDPRRGRRRHEQDDEAGHELLDDVPDPVEPGAGGDGAARGLPDDGEVGGRQPAVRGARLQRVDRSRCTSATSSCAGTLRLRGERVDLRNIEQNLLVVTAGADHIAPRRGTLPLLDLVSSADVEHLDRPGGHIGLMAGSRARTDIWPEIAGWLAERSDS